MSNDDFPTPITPIPLGIARCFLLKGRDGFVLVDTSYPNQYPRFKATLDKKLGITVKEIKFIILTHHHDDHAGFVATLIEESGARLVVHEKALPHLEQGKSLDDDPSYYISKRSLWFFKAMERFHPFTYAPVVPAAGDIVMYGAEPIDLNGRIGLRGQLIHTPGHSTDSISVLLEGGTIICGDTFMNAGWSNFLGKRFHPVYASDFATLKATWTKVKQLGAKIVVPSHGASFPLSKVPDL